MAHKHLTDDLLAGTRRRRWNVEQAELGDLVVQKELAEAEGVDDDPRIEQLGEQIRTKTLRLDALKKAGAHKEILPPEVKQADLPEGAPPIAPPAKIS